MPKQLSAAEKQATMGIQHGEAAFIIDPRSNKFMPYWDIVMRFALVRGPPSVGSVSL